MKSMKCHELGGPASCNFEFQAETFEEMSQKSKEHGMDMFEQGDKEHLDAMQAMKEKMQDPKSMGQWMEEKKKLFEEASEI
jgi:predicted small metal-binding protein